MKIGEVEVTNIGAHGFWLLVRGQEHFLPYDEYPWFREARVCDILGVTLVGEDHLHWPALDVDLSLESLEKPEAFPLVARVQAPASRPRSHRRS
jgi:hypothetical protein